MYWLSCKYWLDNLQVSDRLRNKSTIYRHKVNVSVKLQAYRLGNLQVSVR